MNSDASEFQVRVEITHKAIQTHPNSQLFVLDASEFQVRAEITHETIQTRPNSQFLVLENIQRLGIDNLDASKFGREQSSNDFSIRKCRIPRFGLGNSDTSEF